MNNLVFLMAKKQDTIAIDIGSMDLRQHSQSSWLKWSPLVLVVVLISLYWSVTSFGLIGLDDTTILQSNSYVLSHVATIKTALTTDAFFHETGSFYRPLQNLSFLLDAHTSGSSYTAFHLTNIVLFCVACVVLFFALRSLGFDHLQCLMLSAVYAVHPLFVSTVAWIPSRGDILLSIFCLLGLISFIRYQRTHSTSGLLFHGLVFFAALLSKESAIALPLVCLGYHLLSNKGKASLALLLRNSAVWIVAIACWLVMRSNIHSDESASGLMGLSAFVQNIRLIPETVGKFFVPMNFKLIPLFNTSDTLVGMALLVTLCVVLSLTKNWREPRIIFGLLWFFAFLLPVMLYRKEDASVSFDYLYHRSFICCFGLLIVSAQILERLMFSKHRRLVIASYALVILGCVFMSKNEQGHYRNAEVFFAEALQRTPNSALCYHNVGLSYTTSGQSSKAISSFSKAIKLHPQYATAHINRGNLYFRQNDLERALQDYNRGLELNANSSDAYSNRGAVLLRMGQHDEALRDLNIALTLNPYYAEGYQNRGVVCNMLQRYAEAQDNFTTALGLRPDNASAYFGRGISRFHLQLKDEAYADLSMAVRLGSHDAAVYREKYFRVNEGNNQQVSRNSTRAAKPNGHKDWLSKASYSTN